MNIEVKENSKLIAKNTLFLFFRMLLVTIVGFYTSRVVLNVLGIEDFGVYNIVGSIVVFLSFFKNALTNATYRFLAYDIGRNDIVKLKQTFSMSINVHIILGVLSVLVLEVFGVLLLNTILNIPNERLYAANWVLQFSILIFFVEVVKTPYNSIIIAHEKMNFYALTSIIEVILKLVIVYLLMISIIDKLILYSILMFIVSLIIFVWYYCYCFNKFSSIRYRFFWSRNLFNNLLSYSGWSLLVNAADVGVYQCLNIFLNIFYGVLANAAMGIANQVNAVLNNFLNTFTNSFNPQIIKSYAKGNYDYFMKLIFATSKISFYLLFSISFPVMININYLLRIWLVNPPEMASLFLQLIVCYSLIDSFSAPLWNAVHATGNIKTHQILMASIKLLNIPFSYIMLHNGFPAFSILLLYVFINGVCSIVRVLYMKKLINLDVVKYFKDVLFRILLVTIISIILPILSFRLLASDLVHFLLSTTLFLIPYLIIVYYVGLNAQEKILIKTLIESFVFKKK